MLMLYSQEMVYFKFTYCLLQDFIVSELSHKYKSIEFDQSIPSTINYEDTLNASPQEQGKINSSSAHKTDNIISESD